MEMDEETFIDKNLTMEGQDTDTFCRAAGSKRRFYFDLVDFQRIKQPSIRVTVCLGLLCAVLLAANIGQLIYHASHPADNTERDWLQSRHNASTAERKQLEGRLSNLTEEKDQLQQSYNTLTTSKDYLQISYNSLQREKEQLQTSYNTLQRGNEQLQTNYFDLAKGCVEIAKQFKDKMVRTAVQVRSMPCQTGWRKFGDSCYIVSTEKKNWTAGRDACNAEGAELVVINSRDEQAFVNGLLTTGQNAWIGLTDSVVEGKWTWADGTPVTTTYWKAGQPNSYNGNQDCGETVQKSPGVGEWNDEGCSAVQMFICEQ
ncbi:C-type lectin domain family 4 member M-like [Anoplopoma fimbria]|uniref:C-type lectin domain family 4 member M-like n=1 Tax=Anoplopoma fimbria TaxID=229290 RepID=UPI0023EAA5F5|nr:C-type lectin domain family 4 member M-like [Anoplopoma fimbria]